MAYSYPSGAALGASKTGLAIGYRLIALDGSVTQAFSTTNVVETSVPGSYTVTGGISLPSGWQGRIEWGTSATKYAEEWIGPNSYEYLDTASSSIIARLPTTLVGGRIDASVGTVAAGAIGTASFAVGTTIPHVTLVDTATAVTNPVSLPGTPPAGYGGATAAALAAAILVTPTNLLATNQAGQVTASNLPTDYQQRGVPVTLPTTPPTGYGVVGGIVLAANGLDNILVEQGINARQALSPILAAAAGVLSGAAPGGGTIRCQAGGNFTITRVQASVDAYGNRTNVNLYIPT